MIVFENRKMYSARDVSEILGVSYLTVIRMLDDGRLNGRKMGQRWLINQAEVRKLVLGEIDTDGGESNDTDK